jgi:hypothetical protein
LLEIKTNGIPSDYFYVSLATGIDLKRGLKNKLSLIIEWVKFEI